MFALLRQLANEEAQRALRACNEHYIRTGKRDHYLDARYEAAERLVDLIDEEIGNWFVATSPTSMLRQNLLVSRSTPRGRLTLFNRELSLRTGEADAPAKRTLATRGELADVLADEFGLRLEAADLDAVMVVLDAKVDG
jgi:arylamine N-acetyltransferase